MSEFLHVVDENDNLLGFEKREVVHNSKLWHRGIHIFIENRKGEILLQLRSKSKDKFPSKLDCSVSEHVKKGEDYETCAKRALKEELGIETKLEEIAYFRMKYGENDFMVCKLYKGKYDGMFTIDKEEVEEILFFSKEDLKKMLKEKSEFFAPWTRELLKFFLGMESKITLLSKNSKFPHANK